MARTSEDEARKDEEKFRQDMLKVLSTAPARSNNTWEPQISALIADNDIPKFLVGIGVLQTDRPVLLQFFEHSGILDAKDLALLTTDQCQGVGLTLGTNNRLSQACALLKSTLF